MHSLDVLVLTCSITDATSSSSSSLPMQILSSSIQSERQLPLSQGSAHWVFFYRGLWPCRNWLSSQFNAFSAVKDNDVERVCFAWTNYTLKEKFYNQLPSLIVISSPMPIGTVTDWMLGLLCTCRAYFLIAGLKWSG
jgi:hypothetical protein